MEYCGWLRLCVLFLVAASFVFCDKQSAFDEQLQLLSKQVKALLDRRKEDLQIIEESLKNKLVKNFEIDQIQKDVKSLRLEIDQLKIGSGKKVPHLLHVTQEENDHLTVKWLSNAITEVKIEVSEMQAALNATKILQNREKFDTKLSLLKTDVSNLNKEFQNIKTQNIKYEAEWREMRQEFMLLKDQSRNTAVMCGKIKNQLKKPQVELNYNYNKIKDIESTIQMDSHDHASRHQRLLKKRVMDLEKNTQYLLKSNDDVHTRILKLENELLVLQKVNEVKVLKPEIISGNKIEEYLKTHELSHSSKKNGTHLNLGDRLIKLEQEQRENRDSIVNISKQITNFDKIHISMLELLENLENLENRVDKNIPEFRKEISKLEVENSEIMSEVALLKEDETNTKETAKAISVSVSNLKDKVTANQLLVEDLYSQVEKLHKSSSLQTSKLQDHILKSESTTVDSNDTKSAINFVQELKSFENEYKNIVNKLPHDCNSVSGPNGVYLISPGDGELIMAYCQDGWTTIQKRYDGSVNFNRNWNEYSNGFGSAAGEHWLGNRNIHYLTKENCTKLEINMVDIYGKYWQAIYDDFRVADYSLGFKLVISNYKGNASDALDYQNHMEFSTIDNDRDISNTHCASNYEGGWWFSHCQHVNLNGRYNLGLTWFDSTHNEWIAVAKSEMRVKKRDTC